MADLLVVGAGVAGWVAASRAQDLGLSVTVVEAHPSDCSGGNGLLSGGWFHAAYREPNHAPDLLYQEMLRTTDGTASEEVVRAFSQTVGDAFDYLKSLGAEFAPFPGVPLPYAQNVLQPSTYGQVLGREWRTGGPNLLFAALRKRLLARGGRFVGSFRAVELIRSEDRVVGARSDAACEERAKAVLLCEGGFQGDRGLVTEHITSDYLLRASASDRGDAIRMGMAVGAATTNMNAFYGHLQSHDALTDDRLWPEPALALLVPISVIVGADGARYCDERRGDAVVSNLVAWSAHAGTSWMVVTAHAWETVGRMGFIPPNPALEELGARLVRAADVRELAAALEMPCAALDASIAQLDDAELATGLVALPIIAGITYTMGGLLVDGRAQVKAEDGTLIAGLYAAGGSMGGLQGGPSAGYSGGWSEAATFGYIAAESISRDIRR